MTYLDKVNICSIVEKVPHDVAEEDHLARAVGEAKHTLESRRGRSTWCCAPKVTRFFMGGLGHLEMVVGVLSPLGHCPEELAALGEPDGIVAAL